MLRFFSYSGGGVLYLLSSAHGRSFAERFIHCRRLASHWHRASQRIPMSLWRFSRRGVKRMSMIQSVRNQTLRQIKSILIREHLVVMPAQYGREHTNPELVYPYARSPLINTHLGFIVEVVPPRRHETVLQPTIERSVQWARYIHLKCLLFSSC